MKSKTTTPGFFAELTCSSKGMYNVNKKSTRYFSNIVIPELQINRFSPRRKRLANSTSDCSDKLSNCNSGCDSKYPSNLDGPDSLNKEMREACQDGCAAADRICRNPTPQ